MKLGIVGLDRSGKTTIFNALTRRSGEAPASGGQPSPVLGVVSVPDPRLDWLSALYRPNKTTYAQVTYLDLQGMPAGSETKQQTMSLLLTHMRPMDAFLMVLRNFELPGTDPPDIERDFRELEEEFVITDLATVERRIERMAVDRKKGRQVSDVEKDLLESCLALLNQEQPLRLRPDLASAPELRGFTFLSAKPVLAIVNNSDEDQSLPQAALDPVEAMVVRGQIEMEMAQLPEDEAALFREEFAISETALTRVVERSYALLRMISFFTVLGEEVRAWTVPDETPALEAAGAVHSDIQRGFIRAEVVAFEDLHRAGDLATARKQGTVRLEGKTYPVRDGDVITFRFNV